MFDHYAPSLYTVKKLMSKPSIDRNFDIPPEIVKELLTESEWRMVKQRLLIIELLEEGLSIRKIAERARVGTDTVVRISKMLEGSSKLRELIKKPLSGNSSKWVFGQVSEKE